MTTRSFNRTVSAVDTSEDHIGDALRADITADIEAGVHATNGLNYFTECAAILRLRGFAFDPTRLQAMYVRSVAVAGQRWIRVVDELLRGRPRPG